MTANAQPVWIEDITEVYKYPNLPKLPGIQLTCYKDGSYQGFKEKCLTELQGFFSNNSLSNIGLISMHAILQPDTRIIRYNGFWRGATRNKEIDPLLIGIPYEISTMVDGKIRFIAGAMCLSHTLTDYAALLSETYVTFFVILQDESLTDIGSKVGRMTLSEKHLLSPSAMLSIACNQNTCFAFYFEDSKAADWLICGIPRNLNFSSYHHKAD